jgi:predicted nuclease of restriction endonuclease-like (RecB) superfamily
MAKKKNEIIIQSEVSLDELKIYEKVVSIIETRTMTAGAYANREVTLMYWEVGHYINTNVLNHGRADYGKKILPALSAKLMAKYGKSFTERNLYRMMLFAERFSDVEILPTLSAKLSWSHIIELLPLKTKEAQLYYAEDVAKRNLGVRELRHQISRKAYERREIANTGLSSETLVPFNTFKDPYLLDVLGLKDNFLEADLEKAILAELEAFILEFGNGLSFVARQKRMIIDGEDIVLDLLFYHRILKRLIAIELKLGRFKAAYKSQMELYLKWLDRNERQPSEERHVLST